MMNKVENGLRDKVFPKVSVIMNCLNSAQYLREAIDSVYNQTYQDWEIIFWDNCSTDNSADIAKSYGDKLKYFRGEKTVALGQARNWAIKQVKGEYIAFLDCDDIWFPEKLTKQVDYLKNNSKTGLVFTDSILFGLKGKEKLRYGNKKPHQGYIFKELLKGYFLSLDTIMVRKEIFNDLTEWFDNRFNMIEEAELFLRIAYYGRWNFNYIGEVLSKWRMHRKSWSFAKKHLYPQEKEIMLDKFSKLFEEFNPKFVKEIEFFKSGIQYEYAMLDWEKGNNNNVRKRLEPYLLVKKKCLVPYIFSFFPYSFYQKLSSFFKILPG